MTPPSSAMSNYSTMSRSYSTTTNHKSELFIPIGSLRKSKKPPRRSISTYDWSFGASSVKVKPPVQPTEPVKLQEPVKPVDEGFTRSDSPNGPRELTTENLRTEPTKVRTTSEPKPAAKPIDKTRSQSFPQRSTTNVTPEKFYEAQQAQSKEITIKVEKTKKGKISHQEMKLPSGTTSMNFEMRSFNLSFPFLMYHSKMIYLKSKDCFRWSYGAKITQP